MTILAERSCAVLRNLQAYFPVLNYLPRHIRHYHPEPKITYHTESVSLDLHAKEQEVHLNIPLNVSATEWSHKKTQNVQNNASVWNAWCLFGCGTHPEPQGCDGSGHFQASVILRASFNLASGKLHWQLAHVQNRTWGECLDDLPWIGDYDAWDIVRKLQDKISKNWTTPGKQQVINLASRARLFLEFQTPRIVEADGTQTISGSVFGCVQDRSKQLYPISRKQRSLQTYCYNRSLFTTHESEKNQPIRLDTLESRHLVFRWHGSPKVAINIGNQVTATIAEGSSKVLLTSTQRHNASTNPGHSHFWESVSKEFSGLWHRQQHATGKINGRSQNQEFWLTIFDTDGQKQISLGKGSAQGQHVLAQKNITARGSLNLSLSSLDSNATWQVSFGHTELVCDRGMPTTLSQGHGAVRLSTQLFGAVLGVQAQHYKHYVSNATTALRDANIHHSLEVGDIQLKVMPPEGVNNLSLVSLSVKNSSTKASCDGRAQPLLYASLDRFQGSASLIGRQEGDGNLLLSTEFEGSDASSYSLQGPHFYNPNVPVSQAAVQANKIYVLKRLLPGVNAILKTLDLVLPQWLAQFIPCEVQSGQANGRCLNMGLQRGSIGQGFVEFSAVFSANDPVPEVLVATSPDLLNLGTLRLRFLLVLENLTFWLDHLNNLVKGLLRQALEFPQSHPKCTSLFLGFAWLAWIGLAWHKSPKYAVSAFMLATLLWGWHAHSPFAGFTATALSEFGVPQITSIKRVAADMQTMTQIAMVCTFLELLMVPCWASLFNFCSQFFMKMDLADGEKEDIAYWCFSALVLRSQVWLLVDMPLTYFLGRELGAEIAADSAKLFPSSPLHLVEVVFNLGPSEIHHMTGTMISCSFTSMFVSLIGMYLIYFLLALPVGMFLGAVAFVVIDGPGHWSPRVATTTKLCILITELLSTASILGPFIIAYQILCGTMQWWLAFGLMGVCRPLFAVPYPKTEIFASRPGAILVGLAYVGISVVGGILLWKSYNGALDRRNAFNSDTAGSAALVGRLSKFTFAMYATTVWFLSSSGYRLLCDVSYAKRAGSKLAGQIEKAVSEECRSKVFTCIQGMLYPIPYIQKLLHTCCSSQKIWQTLLALWELLFAWLVWLLEMDALVSFLYHLCKVLQLGWSLGMV